MCLAQVFDAVLSLQRAGSVASQASFVATAAPLLADAPACLQYFLDDPAHICEHVP